MQKSKKFTPLQLLSVFSLLCVFAFGSCNNETINEPSHSRQARYASGCQSPTYESELKRKFTLAEGILRTYRRGKPVGLVTKPSLPVRYDGQKYYWNRRYYEEARTSSNETMCIQEIPHDDSTFRDFKFKDGRRITEIVFSCQKDSSCCEWRCCTWWDTWSDSLSSFGSVLFFIFIVLTGGCCLLCCCVVACDEGLKEAWKNRLAVPTPTTTVLYTPTDLLSQLSMMTTSLEDYRQHIREEIERSTTQDNRINHMIGRNIESMSSLDFCEDIRDANKFFLMFCD